MNKGTVMCSGKSKVPAVDCDGFFDLNTFRHALGHVFIGSPQLYLRPRGSTCSRYPRRRTLLCICSRSRMFPTVPRTSRMSLAPYAERAGTGRGGGTHSGCSAAHSALYSRSPVKEEVISLHVFASETLSFRSGSRHPKNEFGLGFPTPINPTGLRNNSQ